MIALTICPTCPMPHYINCGTCFGWGIRHSKGKTIPVTGGEAIEGHAGEPCPECGSTIAGIPSKEPA